jgi:hypothetical protein
MDHARWDALTRSANAQLTRRGSLRTGMSVLLGTLLLNHTSGDTSARNACQVRCGGDRRVCKGECRDNVNPKQCKKTCEAWHGQCLNHCEFKSLRRRTVNDEYDRMRRRMSG